MCRERRVELRVTPPQGIDRDVGIGGAGQRPRSAVDPVQLQLGPERVQHDERDPAIRRQLATGDRDHPERAGRERRLTVRPRRVGRPRREDANADEAPAHGAEALRVQGEPGLLEDLPLLRVGRLDAARVTVERTVGCPEQQHPRPGDRERDPVPIDRDRHRGVPAAVAVDHEVGAATERDRRPGPGILEPPHLVDPGPGRVDDGAGADLQRSPRQRVAHLGDGASREADQLDPVEHDGAGAAAPRRFARHSRASSVCASG